MSLISNISHKTWLFRRCFSCNCNCSYKIGLGFQRNGHHFYFIQSTMIWSFEGHDRLKLNILQLTCQKFLHLQGQWQWTWIQSQSSQTRPQRSPTDAPHMWCELMRFASSKCMCHGTSIPFWSSNDCALLCELLLHLTKLWNLLPDKALTSWMVSNLCFQEEVLVKMGWAPAPLSLSLALRNSQLALLVIHKQYLCLLQPCSMIVLQPNCRYHHLLSFSNQQAMDWLAGCIQPWEALENWPQLFSHCSFAGEQAGEWAPAAAEATYNHFELSQHTTTTSTTMTIR